MNNEQTWRLTEQASKAMGFSMWGRSAALSSDDPVAGHIGVYLDSAPQNGMYATFYPATDASHSALLQARLRIDVRWGCGVVEAWHDGRCIASGAVTSNDAQRMRAAREAVLIAAAYVAQEHDQ